MSTKNGELHSLKIKRNIIKDQVNIEYQMSDPTLMYLEDKIVYMWCDHVGTILGSTEYTFRILCIFVGKKLLNT